MQTIYINSNSKRFYCDKNIDRSTLPDVIEEIGVFEDSYLRYHLSHGWFRTYGEALAQFNKVANAVTLWYINTSNPIYMGTIKDFYNRANDYKVYAHSVDTYLNENGYHGTRYFSTKEELEAYYNPIIEIALDHFAEYQKEIVALNEKYGNLGLVSNIVVDSECDNEYCDCNDNCGSLVGNIMAEYTSDGITFTKQIEI